MVMIDGRAVGSILLRHDAPFKKQGLLSAIPRLSSRKVGRPSFLQVYLTRG